MKKRRTLEIIGIPLISGRLASLDIAKKIKNNSGTFTDFYFPFLQTYYEYYTLWTQQSNKSEYD